MLSGMGAGGQEQNGRAADPVSSWECSKVILRREEIGGFVVPTFTKNVKVGQPRGRTSQLFFADASKLAPCLNIPGDIAERRNCISSLAVVGRDKDENPGVGGMSPTFTKNVKVGQPPLLCVRRGDSSTLG
jgi:hypothetical protein